MAELYSSVWGRVMGFGTGSYYAALAVLGFLATHDLPPEDWDYKHML